jgi:hypothetical protein
MTKTPAQAYSGSATSTTVHIPITFRRRGGRKQVVTPDGAPVWAPRPPSVDSTLVKALARAFRWQRMLESEEYGSVAELAAMERINASFVARVLRMTLLAPDIVEAVLEGQPRTELITVHHLLTPFSLAWAQQRREFRLIT